MCYHDLILRSKGKKKVTVLKVNLSRRGQAVVENHLSLSCNAVLLIEYEVVIKAQPLVKILPLTLTSWVTDQTHNLFPLRYKEGREKTYQFKKPFQPGNQGPLLTTEGI